MDAKFENLKIEQDGKIVILKINRPKVYNALNTQTLKDLECALYEISHDKSVSCLIITGEGEKSFVAGADIAEMKDMNPVQAAEFSKYGNRVFFMISEMKLTVIAAVNGFALGGGCELALACDFIFASDKALFGQPEVKLGVIPGFGGTQRLSRKIGPSKAKELILSGETVKAEEALRIGLADRIYPAEKLLEETKQFAKIVATKGKFAQGLAKRAIDSGFNMDIYKACELEASMFSSCFSHPDQKEGMTAFIEKRNAKWKE
jgi:enoyl-CoA hydratase